MIDKLFDIPTFGLFNNFEIIRRIKDKINEIIDVINVPSPSGGGINYSTDEQDTGLTWIDDKLIYQITFSKIGTDLTAGDYTTIMPVGDLPIDNLIYAECVWINIDGADRYVTPFTTDGGSSDTSTKEILYDASEGVLINLGSGTGVTENDTYIFTLRYTKPIS